MKACFHHRIKKKIILTFYHAVLKPELQDINSYCFLTIGSLYLPTLTFISEFRVYYSVFVCLFFFVSSTELKIKMVTVSILSHRSNVRIVRYKLAVVRRK